MMKHPKTIDMCDLKHISGESEDVLWKNEAFIFEELLLVTTYISYDA